MSAIFTLKKVCPCSEKHRLLSHCSEEICNVQIINYLGRDQICGKQGLFPLPLEESSSKFFLISHIPFYLLFE